jgi:hypothetical protein
MVNELVSGGINKEVVINEARSLLDNIQPSAAVVTRTRPLAAIESPGGAIATSDGIRN